MFTPQQIEEKTFVKAIFGGYDMQSVDEFLGPLTEDYVVLYKENSVLKSKMKVLVEKLEEYRSQEDSMRKALLAAQKTADNMIAATQKQCARMLNDAQKTLEGQNTDLKRQIRGEEARLKAVRAAMQEYITKLEVELEDLKTRQMVEGPSAKAYDFDAEPDPRPVEMARTIKRSLEKRVEEEKPLPGETQEIPSGVIARPAAQPEPVQSAPQPAPAPRPAAVQPAVSAPEKAVQKQPAQEAAPVPEKPAEASPEKPAEASRVWTAPDVEGDPSSPTVVIPDLGDFLDRLTASRTEPAPAVEEPAEPAPAAARPVQAEEPLAAVPVQQEEAPPAAEPAPAAETPAAAAPDLTASAVQPDEPDPVQPVIVLEPPVQPAQVWSVPTPAPEPAAAQPVAETTDPAPVVSFHETAKAGNEPGDTSDMPEIRIDFGDPQERRAARPVQKAEPGPEPLPRKNRAGAPVQVSEDTLAKFADLQFGKNYDPTAR